MTVSPASSGAKPRSIEARAPGWTRIILAVLAVPQLLTGLWAVLSPRHWYDTFPGFGPLLVAADPPFNAHLASDAGAGFLATGLVAAIAAYRGDFRLVALGGVGLGVFALAHLMFHALNPAPGLSNAVNAVNIVVLGLAVLLPFAAAAAAMRSKQYSGRN